MWCHIPRDAWEENWTRLSPASIDRFGALATSLDDKTVQPLSKQTFLLLFDVNLLKRMTIVHPVTAFGFALISWRHRRTRWSCICSNRKYWKSWTLKRTLSKSNRLANWHRPTLVMWTACKWSDTHMCFCMVIPMYTHDHRPKGRPKKK